MNTEADFSISRVRGQAYLNPLRKLSASESGVSGTDMVGVLHITC